MEGELADRQTEGKLMARASDPTSSTDGRDSGFGSPTSQRSTSPSGRRLERRASFSALDPEDEAMRERLAAETRARREAVLKEQAARAAQMEMRLKSTASRSDNDITDEAAGRARVEMAMQSMQRRQAHKEALARSNSDMRQRLSQVKAKTDVDVTDEEAGRFRVEYAAAAQRRRAEEAARRRAENAALRERLKAVQSRTDDGDAPGGYGSPRPGSPPLEPIERPSDVQHTTYLRLREIEANMGRATQLKQQKAELKERARQEELAWKERGRQRFEERVARDREIKAARKHCKLTNQEIGRSIRLEEEHWQSMRESEQRRYEEEMRERVLLANGLDARLDAAEERQDEKERQEGRRMREALAKALETLRTTGLRDRKKRCADIRKESATALQQANEAPRSAAAVLGEQKRQHAMNLLSRRQRNEAEYLQRARANKERAKEARNNARANTDAMLSARRRDANREKANDVLVTEAKAKILEANRREVAEVYRSRFAAPKAAAQWDASPLSVLFQGSRSGGSTTSSAASSPRTPRWGGTPRTPRRTVVAV